VGVYCTGPLFGRLVDRRGPKIPLLAGAALLFTGYMGIRSIYESGASAAGSPHGVRPSEFELLVLCGFLTGAGGNAAVSSALNSTAKSFSDRMVRALQLLLFRTLL
jgi:MFS family permease